MNNAILEFTKNEQVVILKKYIELKKQFNETTRNNISGELKTLVKNFNKNEETVYTIRGRSR